MSHEKQASIRDSMDLISTFLDPIRAQAEKEASMKTAAGNSSGSFKDTSAANPEEQAKQQAASTTQTNLGKEQQALATEGCPQPATTAKPNSKADENKPTDDQGTKTLKVDQPTDQFPKEVSQEITQEQKVARVENLGNGILQILANVKEASDKGNGEAPDGEPGGTSTSPAHQAAARIPNDLDGLAEGGDKTASAEDQVMAMIDKTAALAAQEYFQGYRYGLMKRAQDEMEVQASGIDPSILEKVGGVPGLLDKVAMEFPEAVMPEEVMADEEAAEAVPESMEAGAEEGDPLEAVAAQLDAAGVEPEELQQAIEDVQALSDANIPPEELAAALTEMTGGGGEEPPAEMAAEPAPAPEKEASVDWESKIIEILSR